jgi:hypothetical protein
MWFFSKKRVNLQNPYKSICLLDRKGKLLERITSYPESEPGS